MIILLKNFVLFISCVWLLMWRVLLCLGMMNMSLMCGFFSRFWKLLIWWLFGWLGMVMVVVFKILMNFVGLFFGEILRLLSVLVVVMNNRDVVVNYVWLILVSLFCILLVVCWVGVFMMCLSFLMEWIGIMFLFCIFIFELWRIVGVL